MESKPLWASIPNGGKNMNENNGAHMTWQFFGNVDTDMKVEMILTVK